MAGRMDFERINGGERKNLSGGRMNFDNLKKKFSFEYPENLPSIEQVKQETSNSSYTPESPNKNISISDRVLGAGLSVTKGSIGTVKSIPDLVSFAGNTVSKGKFENTSAGKATRWVSDFFNEAMDIAQDIKPEKIQELEANKIIGRDENGNWSVNAPNVAQATNAILESIPQIPAYLAGGKGVIAIGGKVGQKLQFLADKYKTIGNIFNFVGKNAQPLSQGVVNAPIIASQTASDVYGDVYKTLVDQGIPQEEAKEIAARQGATAGSQIMPIAGVTGMGLGFAQKNTGKVTSRSLKGFAKETVSEAPEEYAQNIIENRNVAQFDTTRDPSLLNPDALNAGALGAITGGAMGSIVGALSKEEKKGEIIKKETVEDTYKRSQENNVNFNDVVDASFEQKTTPQEALDMLILQKSKETETNQEKPLYGIKKAEEKARLESVKTNLSLPEGKSENLSNLGAEERFKKLDAKLGETNNKISNLLKTAETSDPNYAERKQALEKERQAIMSEMDALFPEFQKTQNKVKEAEIVEAPEIKKDEKVKISTIENKKETSQDVVFPIKRVEKAYQHMHLSPGNTAKVEEESLNNEVSSIEKEIKKYNPEISDEELNSIKSSYRKNYIQNRESVWRSAENVVSSAVAGRNKFNKKQADKRGSSYDNSASRFDEWNAKEKESIFEKTGVNKGKEIDRKKENEKKLSKENDAKKKKIEYFVSLKKGDKIKLPGGNDVTVVKKNKTSIVTENGTVWTAKELYGIDHKELQEAYKKKTVVSKTETQKETKQIKNVVSNNKKTVVSKKFVDTTPDKIATIVERNDNKTVVSNEKQSSEKVKKTAVSKKEVASSYLEKISENFKKVKNGDVSLGDFKASFEFLISNKEQIMEELSKKTKPELLKMLGSISSYMYKNEKKERILEKAYLSLLEDYALSKTITYTHGEGSFEGSVKKIVETATENDLKDFSEKYKKAVEEYAKRNEKLKKSFENPETEEEFKLFIQYKGKDKLNYEQLERYDDLMGKKKSDKIKEEKTKRTVLSSQKVETTGEITETKHTKTGEPLFVVKLSDRVDRDVFKNLTVSAKKLGGWYSSYRFGGAVPGFQFKSIDDAENFLKITKGEDIIYKKNQLKDQNAVERLNEMADKLEETSNNELSRERLTNTAKRAREAGYAEEKSLNNIALAKTMRNIANAIKSGEYNLLSSIRTKSQIQELESVIYQARAEYGRKNNIRSEKWGDVPYNEAIKTLSHFPFGIWKENFKKVLDEGKNIKGFKNIAKSLYSKLVKSNSKEDMLYLDEKSAKDASDLISEVGKKTYTTLGSWSDTYKRISSLGVSNDSELRSLLREYVSVKEVAGKIDKAKELERNIVGRKDIGIDFFPTPKSLSKRMVELADIQNGMKVLEPSAGNGNIAEAIRENGVSPDVSEISSELRGILEAKGFNVVSNDFMDVPGKYDRIIMNPPFQKNLDIAHVKHAYSLLNPGGKIVSIMGEGAFFRSGKTESAFRNWLDEIGARTEKLEEGTFTDKTLLNTTGANARMVVIEKPIDVEMPSLKKQRDIMKDSMDAIYLGLSQRKAQLENELKEFGLGFVRYTNLIQEHEDVLAMMKDAQKGRLDPEDRLSIREYLMFHDIDVNKIENIGRELQVYSSTSFDEVQSAFLGNIERVSNLSDKELLESKETEALKRIIESFKDKELTPEIASSLVFNTLEKVLNPDAEGNASSNAFYKNFMIHVGNLKGMTYDEAIGILRHETFHNIAAMIKGEKFDSVLLNWYRGLSESKKIGLFKTSLNDTEEQKQDRYNQYKDHYEKYLSSEKEIEFYMANEAFAHAIQFDGVNTPTMARKIINAVKDLITRILRLLRVQYANKENAESEYRYRKIESMVSDFFNPKGNVNISEENSAKFKEARERLNNLIFEKHKNNFAQYQKEMSMPSLSVKKNELQEHDSRLIDPKHREEYEKTLQEVADLIVQEKEYIQYQKQQSIFYFGWDEETESNYEKFVSLAKTYKKQESKDIIASGDYEQVKKFLTEKGKMKADEVNAMLYGTNKETANETLSKFQSRLEREEPTAYYGIKIAKSFNKITVIDAKESLERGESPASEQYFALKDKLYSLYIQSESFQDNMVKQSIEGLEKKPEPATLATVGLNKEIGKTYTKSERDLLNKKIKDMSKGARMGYNAGRMETKKRITEMFRKKLAVQKEKLVDKAKGIQWDLKMKAEEIRAIKKELVYYIEKNLPVYARAGYLNSVKNIETKKALYKVFARIDEMAEKIEKKNKIKLIVKDILRIRKSDNIAIEYKKEMLEFSSLIDFKKHTKQTYEKMRRFKDFLMKSGKSMDEIPSRIIDMIHLLERKNANDMSMSELNYFHEKLLSLYQTGKTKLNLINAATEHEKARIKESLIKGTVKIDDVEILKAKPGEKLSFGKRLKNVFNKMMFSAKQKGFAIMPMDAFFDLLDGLENYSGANYTNFKKRTDLSFQKYLDYRDFVQSNVLNLGHSLGLTDRNYERIGVYAALKQEGGLDKLIATGVTKEEAESVVLDEKEMKMYKEMRKTFDEMLPRIKKFMRIVYNKDVQQVENYFSFMTDFEAMNDLEMQEKFGASPLSGDDNNGTRRTKTTKKDFTISRKGGAQTIKLNAMSIFLLHTDNVAYMLNMGRDVKILYEVANSQEYKAKAGTRGSVIVLDWLDTLARKGGMTGAQTLRWLDTLRKNVGVAVLGLKLTSALIQPTALFDGAAKIGRYAFYGATKLSDKKWRQFLMKNFQELRDRVGDDPALLEKSHGFMETIRRGAYSGIKFFDSLTASALTAGAYIKYMDDNGKTIDFENPDPKGVEYAQRMLRITQSSAFFKDVPQAISRGKITGNISLDKALLQFQNFMLTRWSLMRHDAIRYGINKKEYSKSIGIFSYIMLAAISSVGIRTVSGAIIAGLFGGSDDDKEKENGFALKVAKELLSTVPFISQIVGSVVYQSNPVPIIQTAESIFSGAGSIVYGEKAETKQRGVIRTVIGASKLLGVPGMAQLEEFIRNQKESSISTSSSPIVKNGGVKKLTPKKIEIKSFE